MTETNVPSGWYPDPHGLNCERFWDGTEWTQETRPMSILPHRAPPKIGKPRVGLDSNEKTLLIGIIVLILIVALFGSGY
jgi:hypothetical protein